MASDAADSRPHAGTPGRKPRVVLGVSGGIAAYKACELLRRFTESGHDVTVVPTAAALEFVGAPTWAALSGKPVSAEVWTDVHEVPHVRIGQTADLVVVAPATADLLAKAAHGLADDLLTNTLLTARCPVVFAPAMHTEMWEHPATAENVATLRRRGALVIEPAEGRLTGADTGKGRFPDPAEVFEVAREVMGRAGAANLLDLAGRHVLVSAGGTREYLDPVRFLGNRSSGRQGYALARAAAARGAEVTLVAANVTLPDPAGVKVVHVETTAELRDAVLAGTADRRRRGDGRRPRRLPAERVQRHQDQEGRRRLRAVPRAGAEPRHPRRDLPRPGPSRCGRGRVRRRDRRRGDLRAGDGHRQARPQGLRPARGQRRRAAGRCSAAPRTRPSCSTRPGSPCTSRAAPSRRSRTPSGTGSWPGSRPAEA